MKKTKTIAVSGVGGGVGQSIIKALFNSEYKIVGLDSETLATGLYAVSTGYEIPYAYEPDFIEKTLAICSKEKCLLYFPGLDIELPYLAENFDRFKKVGTTVIVSHPKVVGICDNKLLTNRFLLKNDIPAPITYDLLPFMRKNLVLNFPAIIKPKKSGARSQNVFLIKRKNDLEAIITYKNLSANNFIIQEYIEGEEYTCGSIFFDGQYYGSIVLRRIIRDGDTYKCFTVRNKIIEDTIEKVIKSLQPFGVCNIQLRLRGGTPYIFEMNARCSGTTAAKALAGFNEPEMIADYLLHGKYPAYTIRKISFLRYWKELVVQNSRIQALEKNKHIENRNFQAL